MPIIAGGMVEARVTRDGARDIRDTCGGGQ